MKFLSLLFVSYVSLIGANLVKSGDYVIDKTHNLMWEDTPQTVSKQIAQVDTQEYCSNMKLGGYLNWRVPSVEDYKFIIDKKSRDDIKIAKEFIYRLPVKYWTNKTTWRNFGLWAYYVYQKSGTFYYDNKTYLKYIRCVRDIK